MMRKLLNILAVIIGLAGACVAVTGGALLVTALARLFTGSEPVPDGWMATFALVLGGGLAFLGGFIASRALLHLRKPDAGTARDMIGTAIYLIAMLAVLPLLKDSAWSLALILGAYFFHRFLVRRVTAQAFAPAEPLS
jgi:hypothetical protein